MYIHMYDINAYNAHMHMIVKAHKLMFFCNILYIIKVNLEKKKIGFSNNNIHYDATKVL